MTRKGQLKDLQDEIKRYGHISDLATAAKENAQNFGQMLRQIENLKGRHSGKQKKKIKEVADSAFGKPRRKSA